MIKRLCNAIKNNKGSQTIQFVYILIIVVILLSFSTDCIKIGYKHYKISQFTNEISRRISIQGGVVTSMDYVGNTVVGEGGFIGGSSNYMTYSKLEDTIRSYMGNLGLSDSDWTYTITGNDYNPTTKIKTAKTITLPNENNGIRVDYNDKMTLTCSYKFKWEFMSNFIPALKEGSGAVKRTCISTFKYNYDDWGE